MIGRIKDRVPKLGRSGSKPQPKPQPEPQAAPSSRGSGSGPGFFDTFRLGWEPPRKLAGAKSPSTASSAASARAGTGALPADGAGAVGHPVKEPQLLKQRDELAREFAELQWDLGGIVYEMSSRKQFKPEVLDKQVEKLSEVDSRLGQVERLLRLDQDGAAGTCPSCGALQARGAVFCWQCGKELKPEAKTKPEAKATPEAKTEAGKPDTTAKAESK